MWRYWRINVTLAVASAVSLWWGGIPLTPAGVVQYGILIFGTP